MAPGPGGLVRHTWGPYVSSKQSVLEQFGTAYLRRPHPSYMGWVGTPRRNKKTTKKDVNVQRLEFSLLNPVVQDPAVHLSPFLAL